MQLFKKRAHLEKYCLRKLFGDEVKDVRVVATSSPKESKAYRDVKINGMNINMRLDCGPKVTLIDRGTWIKLGRP
ncbi:unnamed protein product [Cylicostephanus goldi]|uniref:Uncharacterized protein n=1 Tax=Cylicostephanus goldi TaxID=71465 RepID=A0A3P7NJX0_CYLGO|nr:unnamed protein product [Cylicostephanus goldi]